MLVIALVLASCAAPSFRPSQQAGACPDLGPLSRTGNSPYSVYGIRYVPISTAKGFRETGTASWYGKKFHGRRTSSGETYDMHAMTAAHKTLPLPTCITVTNLNNNRTIVVKVNDRGPFVGKRILDLSYAAAQELDLVRAGTGPVLIEAIDTGRAASAPAPVKTKFYLSAGVFSSKANAEQLTDRLKRSGFKSAHIRSKVVSGSRLHQVRVGPFRSDSATSSAKSRLSAIISETPTVVSE